MKKKDIVIGGTYRAKVSNKLVTVRVLSTSTRGGWHVLNENTGREVHFRTAGKFREPVNNEARVAAGLKPLGEAALRSRKLSFAEREAVVEKALTELNLGAPWSKDKGALLIKWLEDNKYDSAYFGYAFRSVYSRRNPRAKGGAA